MIYPTLRKDIECSNNHFALELGHNVYLFVLHNGRNDESTIFVYGEEYESKVILIVIPMAHHYIKWYTIKCTFQFLAIFATICSGENINHGMMFLLPWRILQQYQTEVYIHFLQIIRKFSATHIFRLFSLCTAKHRRKKEIILLYISTFLQLWAVVKKNRLYRNAWKLFISTTLVFLQTTDFNSMAGTKKWVKMSGVLNTLAETVCPIMTASAKRHWRIHKQAGWSGKNQNSVGAGKYSQCKEFLRNFGGTETKRGHKVRMVPAGRWSW